MLISALYDYAEYIDGFAPEGWQEFTVTHRIILSKDGKLEGIEDIRKQKPLPDAKGKNKMILVPEMAVFPVRKSASKIASEIIEHRGAYIFGLNSNKTSFTKNKAKFESFKETNLKFFEDVHSELCEAYKAFMRSWVPEENEENPILLSCVKDFESAHFSFCLHGSDEGLERDPECVHFYNEFLNQKNAEGEKAFCCITGEYLLPARTHKSFRLPGSDKSNILVCMNAESCESYNRKQSLNASISEKAATQYARVMDYLLKSKTHHKVVGDMTLVYFAMKKNDEPECSLFGDLFDTPSWAKNDNSENQNRLDALIQKTTEGKVNELPENGFDENVTFYVIDMTPNASRVCIKFMLKDKFGEIIRNFQQHQADMRMKEDFPNIGFYSIGKELVSPKSSDTKPNTGVMSALMFSAMNGTPYPNELLSTIIQRVRTDSDEETNHFIKINPVRLGVIKACINRNKRFRNQKEEFTMSWNPENKNPAYLCGSLFAVYEKIQRDASSIKLNRTIKDSYFSSACSYPQAIMPRLEKLSQNHFKKLSDAAAVYYQKLINELMSGLNGKFPASMLLEQQGEFIIGYHQMNQWLYTKKEAVEEIPDENV